MPYDSRTLTKYLAYARPSSCFGICAVIVATAMLMGCATTSGATANPGSTVAYLYEGEDGLLNTFAPIFVVEHDEKSYNKIGTPSARYTDRNKEEVFVDSSTPTIFHQVRTFQTERGKYTNLIYRIHFERSPFTWLPLNVNAGDNVGAIAVVTLNEDDLPVLLTTVQSCGCYHAITPTNFLDPEAFPEEWNMDGITVYGEGLPGLLAFPKPFTADSRIVITISDGAHRTKDIRISKLDALNGVSNTVHARVAPIEALKALALGNDTVSFYHTKGRKRGLVKGAYKPWETLLFGLWSWDANVGQDREYASREDAGRRFYTTLTASKKKHSDMWDYVGYLNHNGWKP